MSEEIYSYEEKLTNFAKLSTSILERINLNLEIMLQMTEQFSEKTPHLNKIREAMQLILDKLVEDEIFYDVFMSQLRARLLKEREVGDE